MRGLPKAGGKEAMSRDPPTCSMEYGAMCVILTAKRLELVRVAEMSLEDCLRELLSRKPITKVSVYKQLILTSIGKATLYRTFTQTCDLIGYLEKTIIRLASTTKSPINISLPELSFDGDVSALMLLDPRVLWDAIETLVTYMNALDLSSIYKQTKKIKHDAFPNYLNEMAAVRLAGEIVGNLPTDINITTARKILSDIRSQEISVVELVYEIEDYHKTELAILHDVQSICRDIVNKIDSTYKPVRYLPHNQHTR